MESLRQKEAALTEATMQLQKIQEDLEALQKMYDAKMKEKEDLIKMARGMLSLSLSFLPPLSLPLYIPIYLSIHLSIYLSFSYS